MLATKRSTGVTLKAEPKKNSLHVDDKAASRGINPSFETKERCYLKSRTEIPMAPQN